MMHNAILLMVFLEFSPLELRSVVGLGSYGEIRAAEDLLLVISCFHILMIMAIVVDDIWMVQMGVAVGGLVLGLAKDPLAMSLSS